MKRGETPKHHGRATPLLCTPVNDAAGLVDHRVRLAAKGVFRYPKTPQKLQTFHHIETLNIANDACMEH